MFVFTIENVQKKVYNVRRKQNKLDKAYKYKLFIVCMINIKGATMTKAELEQQAQIISKYSLAIGGILHPSQVENLHNALDYWQKFEATPRIDDAFVKLAFMMIVSDFIYQEREERK